MDKTTYSQKAYEVIKKDLMQGRFEGYINGRKIAGELGTGYSPVREALLRLQGEGLVKRIQNNGYFVNRLELKDLTRIFQMRECVELFVWKEMFDSLCEADIDQMKYLHEQECRAAEMKDYHTCREIDVEFHSIPIRLYNNKDLLALYYNSREKQAICTGGPLLLYDEEAVAEHGRIIEGVEREDKEGAIQMLQSHILNFRVRMQNNILKETRYRED